jgi:hypothetical protein
VKLAAACTKTQNTAAHGCDARLSADKEGKGQCNEPVFDTGSGRKAQWKLTAHKYNFSIYKIRTKLRNKNHTLRCKSNQPPELS